MSLFTLKNNILNEIKAIKSLSTLLSDFDSFSSFNSVNNQNNSLDFLLELLRSLIGLEELKAQLIDFLTYNLEPLEQTIKELLKALLGGKFQCGIDTVLPEDLIDGFGAGFNITVRQIDFFSILKTDPDSIEGEILYGNIERDLNRFIWDSLQGNVGSWKSLIILDYKERGVVNGQIKSNVLNIKIDSSWHNKSVNDFMNKFIDSVNFFNLSSLINQTINLLFSPVTSLLNLSEDELRNQAIIEEFVDRIINLPDVEIDNSYYEFNRLDEAKLTDRVNQKRRGFTTIVNCDYIEAQVDINSLLDFNNSFELATTKVEQKFVIDNLFTTISQRATRDLDITQSNFTASNLIVQLFKGVIKGLTNIILSPKVLLLINSYFKIVGQTIGYVTFEDFFNDNKEFFIEIIRDVILPQFITFLLNIVKKELTAVVLQDQIERQKEMLKNQLISILSLLGIPDII